MTTSSKTSSSRSHAGQASSSPAPAHAGVVVGTLVGFENEASPLVAWGGRPAQAARTIVHLQSHHIGESVAVQFADGDPDQPLVMGVVKSPSPSRDAVSPALSCAQPLMVTVDEEHVMLTAKRSITLQCGRASITLDDKGQVEIRGTHILSRSSGQNRIKGTSVSLN